MTTTGQLVQVAKDLFEGLAKTYLRTWLAPLLPIPIVGLITSKIIDLAVSKISDGLELAGFFIYTDIRTSNQGRAYFEAKINGRKAELSGTPEERKRAEDEIKKTFEAFAKLNG